MRRSSSKTEEKCDILAKPTSGKEVRMAQRRKRTRFEGKGRSFAATHNLSALGRRFRSIRAKMAFLRSLRSRSRRRKRR